MQDGIPKRRAALLGIFLIFGVDWMLLDRWQVRGVVIDADTNEGIGEAWVIATFHGQTPLVNIPVPPHPNHRRTECMGAVAGKTDSNGRFGISRLTRNRALAHKTASLIAFKEGWIASWTDTPYRSSIISFPPAAQELKLTKGPGAYLTAASYIGAISSRIPESEFSSSEELRQAIFFAFYQWCGEPRSEGHIAALAHAISMAKTLNERDRVRAGCRAMTTLIDNGTHFPFDCDNLPFKHEPSPEVLAVEAEIKAREAASR
jgi:hypothetical protein